MISANTLFHFTSEMDYLISILKNGVYIRYSLETYGKLLNENSELVLPMTCFCDIPLSKIKEHTSKYGSYSIGLTKEWGINKGISPVLYASENSDTAKLLNSLSNNLSSFFDVIDSDENQDYLSKKAKLTQEQIEMLEKEQLNSYLENIDRINELSGQLAHFLKYIKPYEGIGYSNGKKFKKVRFYDEREWRYVPPQKLLERIQVKNIYKRKFYDNIVKRRYINIKLATHIKLDFTPSDIKFIVVKNDKEIPKMIDNLRDIFKNTATYDELMILNSRIISLEQVIEDL